MGVLFFASGLFSAPSYESKGPARFVRDRLLRLLLPLAAYEFVLQPLAFQIALRSGACGPALRAAGSGFGWYFSGYNRLGHGAGVSGGFWLCDCMQQCAAPRRRDAGARVA